MGYRFDTRRRAGSATIPGSRLLCGASLAALIALGAPGAANAQDRDKYWDANGSNPGSGGDGSWDGSTPLWSDANSDVLGPYTSWDNSALDNAIFGTTASGTTTTAGTITLTGPITVHDMTFQAVNGWTLNGGTLTLAGTAPTLTVNGDTTINSVLAGTAGLIKTGSRTLTLTGANSFSGGITLNGGGLVASTDAALGAAGNNIAVTASSTLGISAGTTSRTVDIAAGATLVIQGVGTGSALYTGAGNLNVSAAGGIRLTNDASTYTGTTRFNGCNGVCSVYFSSIGNLGEASSLGAPTDAVSGTILFAQSSQYSDSVIYIGDGDSSNRNWSLVGDSAVIRNQGTGALEITGNVTTNAGGGAAYSAESADFRLLGTLSGGSYSFVGNAGRRIMLGGANDFTGDASISTVVVEASVLADQGVASSLGAGTSAIAISDQGTLSYTGAGASSDRAWSIANTSGGIANDGTGALNLTGDVALAAASTSFTLAGGYAGANTLSGVISGTGNIVSDGSGSWTLGGANSFTGALRVDGGTLRAGSASAFGNTTGVTVNGGTLDLNDFALTTPTLDGIGGTVALGASGALTVNGATASSYAGAITGGGSLTKRGNGTLTLTGASSYTGGTTIVGGTLALDFSGAGGAVSNLLASGSTLNMSGGTLRVVGAADETNTQSFGTTNVTAGSNTLTAVSGSGGSATLALGVLNRSGGVVNFVLPSSGAITTLSADGLLGGWATINGTDYAKVLGGTIVALAATDYTTKDDAGTWLNGEIISDADGNGQSFSGTVAGSVLIGGLKYSEASDSIVTIGGGNQLAVDGTILVAPSVLTHNQTITGGSLTGGAGGGTLGIQQNGGGIFTIASAIVDNGGATGFVKGGTGTVRLSNAANSYTGSTTLSGGRLEVSSLANGGVASSIGASTADSANLILESGTFAYTGGTNAVSDRGFTLVNGGGGAPSIEVASGRSIEFAGQVTSPDDAGLTKTGWGTLVLSNAGNNYVGVTTIDSTGNGGAGAISVNTLANGGVASGIGAASSDSANLVLTAGGRLQYTGGTVAIDRGFTVANGGGRIDVSQAATTLTIGGAAVGSGQFVKDGAGTLVLSGTNSYTGGTIVNTGTLVAGSVQAFGGAAGGVGVGGLTVNAGATVDLAGNSVFVGGLFGTGSVLLGNATLNINSTGNFSGTISGTGGISVTRFGQTMTGCNNSYTGATSITSTLNVDCIANGGQASGIGASSSDAANLVINGTLTYTGGTATTDRGFTTGAGQIIVNDAAAVLTFTGTTAGTSFTKNGAGTLVLAGTSTRTNNTQVNGGTLRAGTVNAFGSAGLGLGNVAGALIDLAGFDTTATFLNGGGALGGNVALGGATLTLSNGSAAFAGAITGAGNLTKGVGGTQTLTGCDSSYTGVTTVAGGVLAVNCLGNGGANSSIGASGGGAANLVVNGGILRYVGAGDTTDRQFTLGASGGTLDASGTGTIAFTSTAAITLAGTGNRALTLRGSNSGDNILAAQITNPGAGVTSLTKTDVGTWRLTNQASSYTGATTISGGVLSVDKLANGGVASSIGMSSNAAASLVIGSGGTLRYTGTGDSTDRRFTLGVGTTAIESSGSGAVVFANTGAVSYSGNGARVVSLGGTNSGNNIMGAAIGDQSGAVLTSLAKNGTGTWILTGTNAYTGVTNINAGTLILGNGGTSGSIASATVNNFGLLDFNRSDTVTYAGVIAGTGSVGQIGTGTTILTGDSSYAGGTTISAGTLQLGNGGTTGSVVGAIVDNGTLAFNHSNVVTYAGVISGTGSVHQMGPGTLILSGVNSYAGGTTIDGGGTLQIASDANLGDPGGGVTFDNGTLQVVAPIVTNRTLTLAGDGTINVDTSFVTGTSLTLGGSITGAGALTKTGLGTLVLTGDATHGGVTTVAQGTLQIGDGGTTGSIAGDIVNNSGLSFDRSDSYAYGGSISGTGGFSVDGGGTLALTGNSSVGGNITINADSELSVASGNRVATTALMVLTRGALSVSGAGSIVEAQRVNATAVNGGDSTIDVSNGGVIRTTVNGIGMQLRTSTGTGAANLNISGAGSLVDLTGGGGLQAGGSLASTSVITISDGGTLRSGTLNTIGALGGNTIASTIAITGAGSNWTSTGTLLLRNGALSVLDGGAATFDSAQIGTIAQGAGALVSGAGSSFTTANGLTVGSTTGNGILTIADGALVTAGGGLTIAADAGTSGVVNIGGGEGGAAAAAGQLDGAVLFGAGTGRLNFNHTSANYVFANAISGAGTINQVAGVTDLTGDGSAFSGITRVSGGTLRVNGTLGDASSITQVLSGGTLGGAGTIGGDVSIADGGILAPGNSPGTLTINGNLALSAGSILNFEFGQANVAGGPLNDLVDVGGNLTLDGTINVTESAGGMFGAGIYRVFNYAGTLTDNGLAIGSMPAGSTVSVQTSVAGQVNLVNTAGLAFSFWDGAAGPKFNGVINGGSGVWHLAGTDDNWTDAAGALNAAWSDGTTAIFAGAAGTVTIDDSLGAVRAAGMQFATDGYRLDGDALTLTGTQAAIRVGDGSAAGAGYTATIAAALTGSAQLVKTDLGTLILTGANSYTGGTLISGGTLSVANDGLLGSGAVTIDGGTLQLTGASAANLRTYILGANGGAIDVVDAATSDGVLNALTGSGGLTKLGAGAFTLNADNSYTGGTTILAGTLQVGSTSGTTGSIVGDVLDNGLLIFNRSNAYGYAGSITGTGSLAITGTGVTTLTGNSNYGGSTRVSGTGGELRIVGGAVVTSGGSTSMGRSTLSVDGANTVFTTAAIGSANLVGAGATVVNVTNGGTLRLTTGDLDVHALSATAINIAGAGALADVAGGIRGSASLNGAFAMTIGAGGALRTAGASQIGTATSVSNPIAVAITGAGSNWTSAGALLMTQGSFTLDQGGAARFTDAVFGSSTAAGASAALTISDAGSSFATTGDLTIGSGTGTGVLTLGNGGHATVGGGFVLADSAAATGILNIGGAEGAGAAAAGLFDAATLDFGSATSRINFNHTDPGYVFATVMRGAGSVNQRAGTTILTGANSYGGATSVSGGTLLINGDQSAATGLTSVLGGTLGGIGIIGGDVIVADGATLAPGDATGPGTLTVNGNLGLSGGSRLAYDFGLSNVVGGPLNDLTEVGGDLTLDGTIDVTVSPGGSFDVGLYRVIGYGGTLNDQGLALGTMPAGSVVGVQTSVDHQVNLINSAGVTVNFWDGGYAAGKLDGRINGGDGLWQNSAGNDNWADISGNFNNSYPDASFAIFAAAPGTVTVDNSLGAVTASGLQFASDGYVVTGDPLGLAGAQAVVRVGDGTAAGLGYTATIAAALTGGAQLVKTDLGTLVLTGANSYTGGTRINTGTLSISSDANLGDAAGDLSFDGGILHSTADIASGRTVDLIGNATFLTDAGTTLSFNGSVTGAGDLIKDGAGTLALNDTSSHSGGTTVRAGSLFVNGDQSAATGLVSVVTGATLGGTGIIGGDVIVADGATLAPGSNGVGTLTIKGNLGLSAGSVLDYQFGQGNAVGGALNDLVDVDGNLTLDGTINVSVPAGGSFGPGIYRVFNYGGVLIDNGLTLGTLPGGSTVSVQTAVAGQVNLVNTAGLTLRFWDGDAGPKNNGLIDGGSGVWRVGGAMDDWTDQSGAVNAGYAQDSFAIFSAAAGTVTVDNSGGDVHATGMQFASDGYVIAGGPLTLIGLQGIVQVGDGSVAGAGYTATIDAALQGSATLVKTDAGTLVLNGANSYTGGTAIEGGTLRIASDASLGAASGGLSFDGGTLNTTADLVSARQVSLVGAGGFRVDDGTTLTLTGTVSGAGNLFKDGAGTLVLGGTGSYSGATQVGAGTLLVNGDYSAATGTTTIGTGASLGGTGTIGGSVMLADGAVLTPGAGGAGTLTIGGDLMLSGGTRLAYEFGQANAAGGGLNDLVNVGGDLTLDGTIDVTVPAAGAFDVGIYRVFNYGGTLTDKGLTLGGMPAGSNVTVQTSVAGQVNLVNSAGLTLNYWDGAAGPKNDGVINGGAGVWQSGSGNDNWTDASGAVNAAFSDGAFAVFAGVGGTVTVDDGLGQVRSGGMQFAADGYVIDGESIELVGPQATIRVGDGSAGGAGFTTTIGAVLSGDAQLVKTDAGTLVLSGANSFTGGVAINGGTLRISSDANLGAASGGVSLAGGTLATSADLTSARTFLLEGAGTIATADGTSFTLAGKITGAGALNKAGGGTLLLTGDNSGYTAATTISAGTLAVTGALGGAVTANAGTRLEGTGSVGAVTNSGTVAPGRDGFGTLTAAGYTGAGGTLEIAAALGGDGSQSDRLVVNGDTAGTTTVEVVNRGGLGAQTVEGIKIIDVTGASKGAFTLAGDYVFQGEQAVIAGAYGYRLYQGGTSTPGDGDWYLRSTLLNGPAAPQTPLYQPGVPIYEAYGQTLLSLVDLGTLQQRLGDRQQLETLSGKPSGIWGRMESNYARPNAAVSTSAADIDTNSWKVELGADGVLSERADGATLLVGVIGGYGHANAMVRSVFGNGRIGTDAYSVGATLSWFGPRGFYADGRAQFSWFDSKLESSVLGKLADSNHGTGEAYSLELGRRTPVGGRLSVTPQIQMVYATTGFDAFTDPNGAIVSSASGASLKTRWGLSIDRQDLRSHFYAVGNIRYEWLDGTASDVSGTRIAHANERLWGELGLGGSVLVGDRVTLYAEGAANTALNDFGESYVLKGTAGLRLAF